MDDRLARWSRLPRRYPLVLLEEILALVAKGALHGIRREVLMLRGAKQKKARDVFQACLFLSAVREASGKPYRLIHEEPEDSPVDVVAVLDFVEERRSHYFPIQLKELPPVKLNPTITLDSLLTGMAGDTSLADTIVAIYMNRAFRFFPDSVSVPPGMRARQLWLYASPGPPNKFILMGDLMAPPVRRSARSPYR